MDACAVVTGGARNIGAAIAERLTRDGFGVIVIDREKPTHNYKTAFFEIDLSDVEATKSALTEIAGQYAPTRLINNAGIVMPASLAATSLASFEQVIAVNVRAAILCAQAFTPCMIEANIGRIVNISSRAALGKQLRTAYAASKAALIGLTKTWALEFADKGITVNAVGPGPIRTSLFEEANPPQSPRTRAIIDSIPVRRLGNPSDVADAVSFFVSDRCGFVTGQVLYVCGGLTIGDAT